MRVRSHYLTKIGIGLFVSTVFLVVGTRSASAATGGSTATTSASTSTPATTSQTSSNQPQYNFVATDGDSLTLFARRAVDQYAKEQKLTLSPAARVYAETNIVQEFGSRFLNLGESVSLPRALVEKYVKSSQSLSAADTAAWNVYAADVDFTTSLATPAPAPTTPSQTQNPQQQQQNNDQNKDKQTNTDEEKKSSTPWYWWPIGIATLAGLYYILGGKPSKDETKS